MALRITPGAAHSSTTTNTQTHKLTQPSDISKGAPSAPGLPDTLRLSQTQPTASELSSTHPLEQRLKAWTSTQASLRASLQRRTFGIAMPLRVSMESEMIQRSDSFRPVELGTPSKVHDDIIAGRDCSLEWEDVYAGQDGLRGAVSQGGDGDGAAMGDGWNAKMEKLVGMGKW